MPRRLAARTVAACLLAGACKLGAAGEAHEPPSAAAAAETRPAASPAGTPLLLLPDLKQRIEERLARARAARAEAAPLTVATAPAKAASAPVLPVQAAATPKPLRSVKPVAAAKPRAAAPPADPHAWSYEGERGPQTWSALHPDYAVCAKGRRQSPIDIQGGIAVDLEAIRFDYQPSAFRVVDNGHTVEVKLAPGNVLAVGGRRYELQQFHFHRPSEERIAGRQFAMVVHLVHRSDDGRLAVVAVLLDEGPAHPAVQQVWNHLPLEKHEEQLAPVALDPAALLPEDRRYHTYMGSITTPPCTEGVLWLVMQQPRTLSPAQQAIFAHLYPMNARPLQAASGRLIKGSN